MRDLDGANAVPAYLLLLLLWNPQLIEDMWIFGGLHTGEISTSPIVNNSGPPQLRLCSLQR